MGRSADASAEADIDQMDSVRINSDEVLMSLNPKIAWKSTVPELDVLTEMSKGYSFEIGAIPFLEHGHKLF